MRIFEVDVSGEDLLSKNYVICIADKNDTIRGFKFSNKLVQDLSSRYGQGFYRYSKSKKGKSNFKVRLYCVIIYHLFKDIKIDEELQLKICNDFDGRSSYIRESLLYFLGNNLNLITSDNICFEKLPANSLAHKNAFLIRKNKKGFSDLCIDIKLTDFEKWLK
ncbi:MAG: hypothetical protein KJ592_04375 [Nanoarchaeota archaeon]|nr:hypothetical protein [Nanoarchaeota archaeon]